MTPEELAFRQGYDLGRAEGWARALSLLRAEARGMRERGQSFFAVVLDATEKELRARERG